MNNRCTAEDMREKLQYCLRMLGLETDPEVPEGDINGGAKYSFSPMVVLTSRNWQNYLAAITCIVAITSSI